MGGLAEAAVRRGRRRTHRPAPGAVPPAHRKRHPLAGSPHPEVAGQAQAGIAPSLATYFHVDRSGVLTEGQELTLHDPRALPPLPWENLREPLMELLAELFPDGLTYQGLSYLYYQNSLLFPYPGQGVVPGPEGEGMRSRIIELLFELVRRAEFSARPSRLESVFGWEKEEDARQFITSRPDTAQAVIWEVEGDSLFRADMELLRLFTPLVSWWLARRYWSGEANHDMPPRWEHLLKPPVRLTKRLS
jgi:hypothetical protein